MSGQKCVLVCNVESNHMSDQHVWTLSISYKKLCSAYARLSPSLLSIFPKSLRNIIAQDWAHSIARDVQIGIQTSSHINLGNVLTLPFSGWYVWTYYTSCLARKRLGGKMKPKMLWCLNLVLLVSNDPPLHILMEVATSNVYQQNVSCITHTKQVCCCSVKNQALSNIDIPAYQVPAPTGQFIIGCSV